MFVAPDPGALRGYLAALERLRALDLAVLCPGHGPLVLDPAAKLDEYVAHRLERERRLVAALADGLRTVDDLLDRVWADAPSSLRARGHGDARRPPRQARRGGAAAGGRRAPADGIRVIARR